MDAAAAVMERVSLAWETGDYPTLRTLLHPQGSWVFVSGNVRTIFDPDELVEAIRREQERTSYKLYTVTNESLGETVTLASAYIRASVGTTGHRVGRHAFLCELRDGLFFRSEHFHSEHEARAAFDDGWGSKGLSFETALVRHGVEQHAVSA
jgi:hypothetical protein